MPDDGTLKEAGDHYSNSRSPWETFKSMLLPNSLGVIRGKLDGTKPPQPPAPPQKK